MAKTSNPTVGKHRTLYVADEDLSVWNEASALAPYGMSRLVIDLLKANIKQLREQKLKQLQDAVEFLENSGSVG